MPLFTNFLKHHTPRKIKVLLIGYSNHAVSEKVM